MAFITKTGKDALGNDITLQFWENADGSLQPVQHAAEPQSVNIFSAASGGAEVTIDVRGFAGIVVNFNGGGISSLNVTVSALVLGQDRRDNIPAVALDAGRYGHVDAAVIERGIYYYNTAGIHQLRFTINSVAGGVLTAEGALVATPVAAARSTLDQVDVVKSVESGGNALAINSDGEALVNVRRDTLDWTPHENITGSGPGLSSYVDVSDYDYVSVAIAGDIGRGMVRAQGRRAGDSQMLRLIDTDGHAHYDTRRSGAFLLDVRYTEEVRFGVYGSDLDDLTIACTARIGAIDQPAPAPAHNFVLLEDFTPTDGPEEIFFDVRPYRSLLVRTRATDYGGTSGIRFEGSNALVSGTFLYSQLTIYDDKLLPAYPGGGQRILADGSYWLDVADLNDARIWVPGAASGVNVIVAGLDAPLPPKPDLIQFGGYGWDVIEGGDPLLTGRWYALKALTDVTLSSDVQLMDEGSGGENQFSLGEAALEDTDAIAAGDTLYGLFSAMRITSGRAIAYRI